MPDVLFSVPIDPRALPLWQNPPDARITGEKQSLLASPAVGRIDEAAKRLDIYIEYKDFRTRFPMVTRIAAGAKRADDAVKPEGQGGYAQPAYYPPQGQGFGGAPPPAGGYGAPPPGGYGQPPGY